MKRMTAEPVVFQIGFNRCGTKYLASLFDINGYRAKHWLGGALAEDLAYSKVLQRLPFQSWPQAHMFADMESVHKLHRPMIEGFKEYRYLHQCFPEALFILNERNVEEWLASRFCHQGGEYAQFHARHLGVGESALPELWLKDWEAHISACSQYFANNDRFFRYNIDSGEIDGLIESLRPWYRLTRIPQRVDAGRKRRRIANLGKVIKHLPGHDWNADSKADTAIDDTFVEKIIEACAGNCQNANTAFSYNAMSQVFAEWDGNTTIRDKDQRDMPFVHAPDYNDGYFFSAANTGKLDRVQGVVNEILSLGGCASVKVDMQDARRYGSNGLPSPSAPVIVYNRRQGVSNMVLWPLPGYHTPGVREYVFEKPPDPTEFDTKIDRCVWRGNLTGRPNSALAPERAIRRPSHRILEDLKYAEPNSLDWSKIREELHGITRYSVMTRLFDNDDFDLGFTLPQKHAQAAKNPLLSRFCKPREKVQWFYRYKYIASFSGHDTGSNFLMAAASNSVVLKEEDGWELFYTSAFKPWEHYIPLIHGASDLEEKLEWARNNQEQCRDMAIASADICTKLANPHNRRAYLSGILHAYYVASGIGPT